MKTVFLFNKGGLIFLPRGKVLSYAISYESQLSVKKVFFLLCDKMGGLESSYKKEE